MFSRWCLIFGVTLIAFTMHSYGKFDDALWNQRRQEIEDSHEKGKQEHAAFGKKMDEDADNVKKAALTTLILAIVLPIVACVLLLICCGVGIGVTICCVCKHQKKNEKK